MEILKDSSIFPQQGSLILGFFDGIHAGHKNVISTVVHKPLIIVTFSSSPAEYFGKDFKYIYNRKFNYKLLENLGVDYVYEQDFSKIAKITAEDYLKNIVDKFNPKFIVSGFNHTFGINKQGDKDLLAKNQGSYTYCCVDKTTISSETVSSSLIKDYLKNGNIKKANELLTKEFTIESSVIEGAKLGRVLGFPTANLKYPDNIIKIPYGVYKVDVLGKIAVMNWGIKPTIGASEIMEVHIPNFNNDLYGKKLQIKILDRIRDEKKFNNLDELKKQINKDIEECLK